MLLPCGDFDALLNIWFNTGCFGLPDDPVHTTPYAVVKIGTLPNKSLVVCRACCPSFLGTPQSHVNDYLHCTINRFLTNERYRLDRVRSTRPAGQRYYLLMTRFKNYFRSNGSIDHPFYYNIRKPDPPQMECHPCTWKYMPPVPTLPLLEDALSDEAYGLKPGTATDFRKQLISWQIKKNGAPNHLLEKVYPVFPILKCCP